MTDVTGKIKKNNTFPKPFKINKKLIYFEEQIANEFNIFFKNVGLSLAEIIPPILTNYTEYLISFTEPISNSDLKTYEFEKFFKSFHDGGPYHIETWNCGFGHIY